jgi:hypothetical protein
MQDTSLSSLGTQDALWKEYRKDTPYTHEGLYEVPHMERLCFELDHGGKIATLGLYTYNNIDVLKAWGYKADTHCSYHAIKTNGTWSEVIEGCPDFELLKDTSHHVTGFTLSHTKKHIWEGEAYREVELPYNQEAMPRNRVFYATETAPSNMTLKQKIKLYTPLIITALFALTLGGILTLTESFTLDIFLMNSMGVFITTIGLLKLRSVTKFTFMFRQYDPLAKKSKTYAALYPYLETSLGLLALSSFFILPVQLAVIAIYTSTTIGIISSLNASKNLDCGCLGGNIKLPLSGVTIFENLVMITMALYTLSTL